MKLDYYSSKNVKEYLYNYYCDSEMYVGREDVTLDMAIEIGLEVMKKAYSCMN